MSNIRTIHISVESKKVSSYHVMVEGIEDPVGRLLGINDKTWRFDLYRDCIDQAPKYMRNLDEKYFTSYEQAQKELFGE